MEYSMDMDTQAGAATHENFMRQLSQTFEKLPYDIPIYMEGRSGYHNFGRFLEKIEQLPWLPMSREFI